MLCHRWHYQFIIFVLAILMFFIWGSTKWLSCHPACKCAGRAAAAAAAAAAVGTC
jgi:hypothetical protein